MSFFISDAFATASTAAPQGDGVYSFVMIGIIFLIFYFMLIRPQNQRAKALRTLIDSLSKGDEVIMANGMLGKISSIEEQYLKVEIAEKCEVRVQKSAVSAVLPKGTLKSI